MSDTITFTPEESRLLWIDCEMTGLDVIHDELCEVAVVPTDFNLKILDPGFEILIKPSEAAMDHMSDFVRQMHTHNGLLKKMANGVSVQEAEVQLTQYIQQFLPEHGKAHVAGNTIGSDMKFLTRYMPDLMSKLHYRTIDVSTLKELCRRWYPQVSVERPAKYGDDRALGDIIESIDEMRFYRETMFVPQPGMSGEKAKEIADEIEKTSLLRQYEAEGRVLADPHAEAKRDY